MRKNLKRHQKTLPAREQVAIARDKAAETVLAIVFTVLLDKEGADLEIMQRVWKEVCDLANEVSVGLVTIKDLTDVLRKEYDINITGRIT